MIGRVYTWQGHFWLVRVRGEPFDRGPRRNVLIEQVVPWLGVGWGDHWFRCVDGNWWRPDARSWLGERGKLVVRPFRGLRRATHPYPSA
jgi:hypothetical protein